MTLRWDYQTIRSILENGIEGFFPKNCAILDTCFFLDVAIPLNDEDKTFGNMSDFEKTLITISCLCLQESYRVSGNGPVKNQGIKDSFYLVDPELFEERSKLSILNMVFSNLFQHSLCRLIEGTNKVHLSSREGFTIIADPDTSCSPIEVPMRKVPSKKNLGEILIENLLSELDLQEVSAFDNGLAPIPGDAIVLGELNDFEIITFKAFSVLLRDVLEKRAAFEKSGLELKEHNKLKRLTALSEIFNELFARSVFTRFPTLHEDEFLVGEGFVVAKDINPQPNVQFVLLRAGDPSMIDEMVSAEMLTTEDKNHVTPVDEKFDLESWDPGRKGKVS